MNDGIDMNYCINEVRKLKKEGYSLKTIVILIGEAYKKFQDGDKLTKKEQFLLGLRYPEFLASDNSDKGLYAASCKREELLGVLRINEEELITKLVEMYGLY